MQALLNRRIGLISTLFAGLACACGGASSTAAPAQLATAQGAPTPEPRRAAAIPTAPARTPFVYVGSTNGQILLYALDSALGKLSFLSSFEAGNYPSFIAFDPSHAHAYAVNEPDGKVASFSVDAKTGYLAFLNRVDSGGAGPAFVGVDHSGKYVLVANYDGGTTRVFPIAADGSLGAATDEKAPGKNSHMILTDAANRFAFVMNLGSDSVVQYAFDAAKGTLTPNAVPSVTTVKGAGPRHLAFHPNGKFAYLANELNHTLSAYAYDAKLGQLTFLESLSTVPAGSPAHADNAEVVVAPSGKFVYVSTRAYDSIATFSSDATTGKLTALGNTSSGGAVPRSFTLSADGKLMLVANESGNVTSFSVDPESGALHPLQSVNVPSKPQFVAIVTPRE